MLIFKVDFEKAFDFLNWAFLDSIMAKMGFSAQWRKWINGCLTSAFRSYLVNGSPTTEFQIQKILRQGDPLSTFLFILAAKTLHVALLEAQSKNIFRGIEVGKDKVIFSHHQFADDALIMGEWSMENIKNLSLSLVSSWHPG